MVKVKDNCKKCKKYGHEKLQKNYRKIIYIKNRTWSMETKRSPVQANNVFQLERQYEELK